MYKQCKELFINLCVIYFVYDKSIQRWGCRINDSNIVFKHFWLSNTGKKGYFKEMQGHSIVTQALPVIQQVHTLLHITKYTLENITSTLSHYIRSCNRYFYVSHYPQKHKTIVLATSHLHLLEIYNHLQMQEWRYNQGQKQKRGYWMCLKIV